MDRAEPRQPPDAAPVAPGGRTADPGDPAAAADARPALPAPAYPDRPRGRHEAPRRGVAGTPGGVAIAIIILAVVVAGVLATWLMISSAKPASQRSAASATSAPTAASGGPTSRPPGAGAFGNLVINWSFEQDLHGWQVVGATDIGREPQGRTSGSSASVRARGPDPGRIGLALAQVTPTVKPGERYVASAWVRSPTPGQQVTIQLVEVGGQSSRTTTTTLPGLAWRRVIVDHTVATASLRLEIVADEVPPGGGFVVDEVVVRRG
jgi:Carbohydrate binding domain